MKKNNLASIYFYLIFQPAKQRINMLQGLTLSNLPLGDWILRCSSSSLFLWAFQKEFLRRSLPPTHTHNIEYFLLFHSISTKNKRNQKEIYNNISIYRTISDIALYLILLWIIKFKHHLIFHLLDFSLGNFLTVFV